MSTIPANNSKSIAYYLLETLAHRDIIDKFIKELSKNKDLYKTTLDAAIKKYPFPEMLSDSVIQRYKEKYNDPDKWTPVTIDKVLVYYKNNEDGVEVMPNDYMSIFVQDKTGGSRRIRRRTAHRKRKSHRKSKRVHHTRRKYTRRHRHRR